MTRPRILPRRAFVAETSAALAGAGLFRPPAVPAVEAIPTVFHGHPDGIRTLVRFVVRNTDAPAGRMRVYDERTNELLGTAGVLPAGDGRLIGELWLPLQRRIRVRTELEYPGTTRPLRDRFTLEPTPRWTLHWLLLADPTAVRERVTRLDPLVRGVPAAVLSAAAVQLDPVRTADPLTDLAAARIAWPAWEASRATGVPLAPIGTAQRGFASLPSVMQASGLAGTVGMLDEPWTLLDTVPTSLAGLQRLVEERLVRDDTPLNRGFVIVPVADSAPALQSLADAWTSRFAAPILTLGTAPDDLRGKTVSIPRPPLPAGARGVAERANSVAQQRSTETLDLFRTLARRVGAAGDPLDGVARSIAYPVPGRVVFNATPWARTDVVAVGGGELVVTNVPGPGYAFLPADPALSWPDPNPVGANAIIANTTWRVRVDETGAIGSLLHLPTETELAGRAGLCAVDGSRAASFGFARRIGLGEQLIVARVAGGFEWITTYTLYEGVDVVDVAHDGGPWGQDWRFETAFSIRRVRWADPLGISTAGDAISAVAIREWFAMDGDDGTVMVATPAGGILRRDEGDLITYRGPEGHSRARIGYARPALPEDPWRTGARGMPLIVRDAPGSGESDLPSFGRLLDLRDPGVRILGLKPAADGVGIVLYLHDLMDFRRTVTVRPDLLPFTAAIACDLLERDQRGLEMRDGGVAVGIPAGGVVAVRLLAGSATPEPDEQADMPRAR